MTLTKTFTPLVFALALLTCAVLAIGLPNFNDAQIWTTNQIPTQAASIALVQIMVWLVVISGVAWSTLQVSSSALSQVEILRKRKFWAICVMALGIVLLLAGAGHHLAVASVSMYGGSITTAATALNS